MHVYEQIYEFSSSAGALEGYVYGKRSREAVDMQALDVWTGNLTEAYRLLPSEVLERIRPGLDLTLNRAAASLEGFLETDHPVLRRVHAMIGQRTDAGPDDFQKKKWFQKASR